MASITLQIWIPCGLASVSRHAMALSRRVRDLFGVGEAYFCLHFLSTLLSHILLWDVKSSAHTGCAVRTKSKQASGGLSATWPRQIGILLCPWLVLSLVLFPDSPSCLWNPTPTHTPWHPQGLIGLTLEKTAITQKHRAVTPQWRGLILVDQLYIGLDWKQFCIKDSQKAISLVSQHLLKENYLVSVPRPNDDIFFLWIIYKCLHLLKPFSLPRYKGSYHIQDISIKIISAAKNTSSCHQ